MLKRGLLFIFLSLFTQLGMSQTDSTDLVLATSSPQLVTQMDSILFGDGNFEDYLLDFDISDTTDFGSVSIELALSNNQVLFRHTYTLGELQSSGLIDAAWHVSLNFGKFEMVHQYKVNVVIGNYAGVLSPSISKHY